MRKLKIILFATAKPLLEDALRNRKKAGKPPRKGSKEEH